MKKLTGAVFFCLWCMLLITEISLAAVPEDFSFKGLRLGDSVEQMVERLGEPDFDTEMYLRGVPVIRYTYSADQRVYVSAADKRVVEIFCKSKQYVGPHGVCYGATRAGLTRAFGQSEHKRLAGNIYYMYYNPANGQEKMLLEMEPEKYYLLSWTYTSLNVDGEDAIIVTTNPENSEGSKGKRFNYGGIPTE